MTKLSLIMLTNTVNNDIYKMTQNALDSLHHSIGSENFNVVLVESNKDRDWDYQHVNFYLKPPVDFNYNTYLNIAIENCDSEYIGIVNNDVNFHKDWWVKMEAAMIKNELDTASPRSPTQQNGIVPRAEIKHRYTPETMVRVGFELIVNFCGWCWIMKKEVKDWLFPLDEQFAFFFQDNDIIMRLQEKGCKHGMVAASKVDHFGQRSHGTFKNQEEYMKNTFALEKNFIEKWRHRM
jgi:GT2 family glycosyltransferase